MKKKKLLSIGMTFALLAALFTGCAKSDPMDSTVSSASQPVTQSAAGEDEIVTLKWYMSLNPVHPDTEKVIAVLNEYTREKIGVEIDYVVIANPDYREKMPTMINSGDYFDICFTSNWNTDYLQFAAKDAFMDLTTLLPEYAKETWEFVPDNLWQAVGVDGKIFGVPSYKEVGRQGGIYVNSDMAEEYDIDLTKVKTLEDYTEVLKTVHEKSTAEGKNVIGISELFFDLLVPFESLVGNSKVPGASAVKECGNFEGEEEIFNQYASKEYMDFCKLVREWYNNGYLSKDPVNYGSDTANRDNDFKNGTLFSYVISYAPGAEEQEAVKNGHGVTFIPFMQPLFETNNALGGLLAISSASKYPEKAMQLINLLNTDEYVGTLIRHGIEGEHYTVAGENRIDRTMGGTLDPANNGYDYTYGWQFGTPFNQKWDISYPENIEELFIEYNKTAITAPHNGFTFNNAPVESEIAALTSTIAEYSKALENGMVDPEQTIPKFLKALEDNGVDTLIQEIRTQLDK